MLERFPQVLQTSCLFVRCTSGLTGALKNARRSGCFSSARWAQGDRAVRTLRPVPASPRCGTPGSWASGTRRKPRSIDPVGRADSRHDALGRNRHGCISPGEPPPFRTPTGGRGSQRGDRENKKRRKSQRFASLHSRHGPAVARSTVREAPQRDASEAA